MFRTAFALAVAGVFALTAAAQDQKGPPKKEEKKLTVDLFASLDDQNLQKEAPENGVIVSAEGWEKLAKAWASRTPRRWTSGRRYLSSPPPSGAG